MKMIGKFQSRRLVTSSVNLMQLLTVITSLAMVLVGAHILPEPWTSLTLFSLTALFTALKGNGVTSDPWIIIVSILGALVDIGNYTVSNHVFEAYPQIAYWVNIGLALIIAFLRSTGIPTGDKNSEPEWKRTKQAE